MREIASPPAVPAFRTHHCAELRPANAGDEVVLSGWVNNYRDHGGVRFIDLRDREGLTQVVFHPEAGEAHALAQKLRHEDVVRVRGKCVLREGGPNPKLPTGEIEVDAVEAEILGKAKTPPFTPDDASKVGEDIRLKHRYVDLRRPRMQHILRTRHRVTKVMRDFFDEHGFVE
ncbi:MAG: OB-fold nucleic acid binding domain-containing protein, partial [Planctomycetota bacterium]